MVLHPNLICKDTPKPFPFPFLWRQTLSVSYIIIITNNLTVKPTWKWQYFRQGHFSCLVSMINVRARKPGLEFGVLAGLVWMVSKVFVSPSLLFPFLSFLYWDYTSIGKNTQLLACWSPISRVSFSCWIGIGHVKALLTVSLFLPYLTLCIFHIFSSEVVFYRYLNSTFPIGDN